jgi:hypothetical protein
MNGKICRPTRASLEDTAIIIETRVVAETRRGKLFLADGEGHLRPATAADLRAVPGLRDHERRELMAAMTRWRRGGADPFEAELIVPLPPMSEFRSHTRVSPIAKFQAWVEAQAGEWTHPSDVMVAREDLNELLREERDWIRARHDLRGEKLSRAVSFADMSGGPLAAPRGRSIVPGWVFIRSTKKRREGAHEGR